MFPVTRIIILITSLRIQRAFSSRICDILYIGLEMLQDLCARMVSEEEYVSKNNRQCNKVGIAVIEAR